jgi:glycosyltransferase involved in cell wall biosynthesis
MPMGILEALSYGLPCLITEGTTLGQYVRDYGAGWVAETNAQSVFENLVRAIGEMDSMIEKSNGATELIATNFAWEKIARDTIEAYRIYVDLGEK